MSEMLNLGKSITLSWIVTDDVSAERYGNAGVRVLATPALVGWMEATAIALLKESLQDDQGSVGTSINMKHLAATPLA